MPAPTTVATPPLPYKAVAPATRHSREGGNPGWTRGGVVPTRTPRTPTPHKAGGPATCASDPLPFHPATRLSSCHDYPPAHGGPATLPPQSRRAATASDPALPRATSTPSNPVATSPHSVVSSAAPSAWPPGRRTRPCWSSCSVPPPGATPSSPICGRHPLGQPARQGTQTEVNRRRTIQQLRQGRPRRETIAVLPPGQLQKTTKKHKAILHREINHTALLLTEAAKLSNDVLRPPPQSRRASDC